MPRTISRACVHRSESAPPVAVCLPCVLDRHCLALPVSAAPCRETLFRSNLAKVVFLCVATVGDDLRSQHATWQARLQGEVAVLSSSASSPQQTNTDSGNVNKNGDGGGLLPTYSGPLFVSPEADLRRTAMSAGSAPEVPSSSSMFVVFRRCLSSDCPCEANQANVASNVPSSPPLDPNKMLKSKVKRSSTTGRRSKKTSDTPDTVQARTGAQTQKLNNQSSETPALDTQSLRGMIPGKHETSGSTSGFVQETGSSSPSPECEALIVDPRIFTLRARITRSDDVYRALMKWCRSWMADLQLDMRENHEIGSTHESTRKGTLSVLPLGSESVTPEKLLCMTHQVEDVATEGLSPGDETIAREQQLDSEQEALKERWLTAQQKRGKGLKRHPAPARNFFSDQPKVYKQR